MLRLHGPLVRGHWLLHLVSERMAAPDRPNPLPSINNSYRIVHHFSYPVAWLGTVHKAAPPVIQALALWMGGAAMAKIPTPGLERWPP
jgi:hypothetical protein